MNQELTKCEDCEGETTNLITANNKSVCPECLAVELFSSFEFMMYGYNELGYKTYTTAQSHTLVAIKDTDLNRNAFLNFDVDAPGEVILASDPDDFEELQKGMSFEEFCRETSCLLSEIDNKNEIIESIEEAIVKLLT